MSDERTRRDWLVTIGGAAAAGVGLAGRLKGKSGEEAALPPGVYEPSTDHLGHALMNSERYHPIPPGCPTEYVKPRTGPFQPQFFSQAEYPVIQRLVEVILGEIPTLSEGGEEAAEWIDLRAAQADEVRKAAAQVDTLRRALAVAYYGAERVDRLTGDDPARTCRDGLAWMNGPGNFLTMNQSEQIALVTTMSEAKRDSPEGAFFVFLKTETIKGFYTSRTGLKELDFKGNAFYARSPGCWA